MQYRDSDSKITGHRLTAVPINFAINVNSLYTVYSAQTTLDLIEAIKLGFGRDSFTGWSGDPTLVPASVSSKPRH